MNNIAITHKICARIYTANNAE